jgi:glutaconate CoA-transferase subunit B
MSRERDRRELLIATIADLLDGIRHVAVGASSPIPAAGAMLGRARNERDGKPPFQVTILGSERHNFFTNGGVELFDCAAQGRVDAFFLGAGQIDGHGNINLVGTGDYPATDVRWPGSFGSAYLYHLVPRVILFREEHSSRVLVPRVDFISAAAITPEVPRRGGPYALLTNMGCSISCPRAAASGCARCIPAIPAPTFAPTPASTTRSRRACRPRRVPTPRRLS